MKNDLESRRRRYFHLSSQIAQMESDELQAPPDVTQSWGRNHTLDVGREKVFVKRVPITELERENFFSTRNFYNLPTYYNYGVGSAGSGVFRELVANIKTTNWVLSGECEGFPMLYHYRVIPYPGDRSPVDMEKHQGYIDYWGGNENISRYILDRAAIDHELVLFLEYVPHVLNPWLRENTNRTSHVLDQLLHTVTFLRKNGVIHFDTHFHNVLTDGDRCYLTDFGLVLDKGFALTKEEQAFWNANSLYDFGLVLACIGNVAEHRYEALPEAERVKLPAQLGAKEGTDSREIFRLLLGNPELLRSKAMKLDQDYIACLIRHRGTILLMLDFYRDIVANHQKDTRYPQAKLRELLSQSSVI